MNDLANGDRRHRPRAAGDERMEDSNLENYFAGYNASSFIAYPNATRDELLTAHLRGYNLHLIG